MVAFFVKKKAAIFSLAVLIVIIGAMSYVSLPRESVPEIKQPWIFVTTLYPGVAAADIENLVTRTIEDKIDGIEGIASVSSSSQQSLSFIFVKFSSDVSVETALRRVKERVDLAKVDLPDDAEVPSVSELSSSTWPIFITVLSHPDGLAVLDRTVDKVTDELKRIDGVLDVQVTGRLTKEVAIEVDPIKLEHYGMTLGQVINAISSENVNIPGGSLKTDAKNYTINVTGEIRDPRLFEDLTVSYQGKKIPLREIATARFTWAEPKTYSRINGEPCISFALTKRSGENIINIVDAAKKAVDKIRPTFPAGTLVEYSYDQSSIIRDLVADLENNIFSGLVLVLGVTLFFLGGVNSLFVSLAIPFSMLMSFFVLDVMGITLNMVVLFSLVLALGMLVDNGIVIVENIFRHASMGKSRVQASIDGTKEVAWPVITSTLTTCLAFFPIIYMPDVMGDFMSFLPKTVIVVLLCSLFIAMTINPVFCSQFLRISEKNMRKITEGSGTFARFQAWYGRLVARAVEHSWVSLGVIFAIVVAGFVLYHKLGREPIFFSSVDVENVQIGVEMPPGTPLDSTDVIVKEIEQMIPSSPSSLKNFQITTGKGASDDRFAGIGDEFNKAVIRISYKPYLQRKIKGRVALDSLKNRIKSITGAKIKVIEQEKGPPTGNDVSYRIVGDDYAVLGAYADSIMAIMRGYGELKLVNTDYEAAKPEINVEIDREKAAYYGLSTRQIAGAIRNAMNGATVGKFRVNEDEYDIVVRYADGYRNSLTRLDGLQIVNHDDYRIPLSSVATISRRSSIGVIKRKEFKRAVEVWADFRDGVQNKRMVGADIGKEIAKIKLPAGYFVESGEGQQMRNEAAQFLVKAFMIAVFLILIVLVAQFNSLTDPLIIIAAVLLSMGGVFWGYVLTGMAFSIIMSGIGCIALTGVVVNNCIVLIDYTHILIRSGMSWQEAIVVGARTRVRPVLLTAITTILGLLPMVLGVSFDVHKFTLQFGSDSGQMWKAFAWAVMSGLSFATVMTLIMVPCMMHIRFTLFPPKEPESA